MQTVKKTLLVILGCVLAGYAATMFIVKIVSYDNPNISAALHAPVTHQKVDGTDLASKVVITSTITRFVRFKSDSLEIMRLQKLVRSLSKAPGSAAAEIETRTELDTLTQVVHDTIPGSFHQDINNQWIAARIIYDGRDTATLNLKVRNQYEVSFTSRRDSTFVQVHSLNPYTETTGLSAFQVPQKKRRKGAVWIALAAGILGGYLLHH